MTTTHTGDELARARTDLERSIQFHDEAKPLDPWIEIHVDDARCILSALRPTQADNVLARDLDALLAKRQATVDQRDAEMYLSRNASIGVFTVNNADRILSALKATPEPNPEGMQVAERRAIVAWLRHDDIGEWHRLDQSIERTLADAIERGDHLSTLTSASNLSLIGPK